MVAFPHCKINLGLHVARKRPDGFHDIHTCFYPVPFTDVLEILPAETFSVSFSGNTIPGSADENLIVRAYQLLKKDLGIPPVKMHLHKCIPAGAGLGGGSSDGAFVLRMLNEIFDLKLSREKLNHYAGQLGSDCAFFLQDAPKSGKGKGDELEELVVDLKGKFLVLVMPGIHVSTAAAYNSIVPSRPGMLPDQVVKQYPVSQWRDLLKNDFEVPVFREHRQIGEIRGKLYEGGALYASMSGSGSSVYGIFEHAVDLETRFPGMQYWASALG